MTCCGGCARKGAGAGCPAASAELEESREEALSGARLQVEEPRACAVPSAGSAGALSFPRSAGVLSAGALSSSRMRMDRRGEVASGGDIVDFIDEERWPLGGGEAWGARWGVREV